VPGQALGNPSFATFFFRRCSLFFLPSVSLKRRHGVLESWKIGVLEYWNIGALVLPTLHYSNTPSPWFLLLLHHSSTPIFHDFSLTLQIDDLHAVVRLRMLRGWSLSQNHKVSLNAMLPQPLPGKAFQSSGCSASSTEKHHKKTGVLAGGPLRTHCCNPYRQPESGNTLAV